MTTFTPTQARKDFFNLPKIISSNNEEIVINYKDWDFVMLWKESYENLLEHLHLMKDAELMDRLRNAESLKFESFSSLNSLKYDLEN